MFEATNGQLGEVVQMVNRYWDNVCGRPSVKNEIRNRSYWEEVHRTGRIILYKTNHGELNAIMSLIKKDKKVTIDVFLIVPSNQKQEIRLKMLRLAERMAIYWSAEQISWLFYNREDIEIHFPIFQQLGYTLHCPLNQKGYILLEKKLF
jgi:hypothetical protein